MSRTERGSEPGKHLSSGCGSETGKDERKLTESRVHGTGKMARETRPGIRGKPGKRERNRSTGKATCEARTGRWWKRKNRWLSSEVLKRKRTKESGSQVPIPEERSKREAPVEQLWERSREGRKETNRKLST